MSTPINDGGPAFPHISEIVCRNADGSYTSRPITSGGMTLRDHFASQALAGQLAAEGPEYGHNDEYIHPETDGPVIGKNSCFAVMSGDGKTVGYQYDRSKPLTPILKRSYAQAYAEISYELADAMLVARERKGTA